MQWSEETHTEEGKGKEKDTQTVSENMQKAEGRQR